LDDTGALEDTDGNLAALLRFCAHRAENWYSLGLRLIPHLDRRSAACCMAMAGIYRRLLTRINTSPVVVYDRRISLTGAEKARVAALALAKVMT
jgi:phytoene synthase